MAPRPTVRLALAALAVVAVASCSGDDPEPVATGGGIQLASTTTEQPNITEPKTTTTTEPKATTTTSTTTTSTTTTTTQPVVPTVDELAKALPGAAALPGGPWDRGSAPTELSADPGPLCDGSTVATPLSGVLDQVSIAGGVSAQYDRADGRTTIQLVVAPLQDVAARLTEATTEVAGCPDVSVSGWPTLGDASLSFSRAATTEVDGSTWAIAQEGKVVFGLTVRVSPADGVEAEPPPSDAALQAFLQAALDGLPDATTPPSG